MKEEAKLQTKIIKFLRHEGRFVIKTQGGTPGTDTGTHDVITICSEVNKLDYFYSVN